MLPRLGNVSLVLSFHLFSNALQPLHFVLVLVSSIMGGGQRLGETLVFRFESFSRGLEVAKLRSQLLKSDLEIPVFFLVLV
jgi:hypothetical protein